MDILGRKNPPQKDYKEILKKEDNKTINALPDFEIRTMKGDLAGLGVKKLDKSLFFNSKTSVHPAKDGIAPPVPIAPKKPLQAGGSSAEENTEPEPELKTEISKTNEGGMIVPENLPVALPQIRKSALPSTEELVSKKEEPIITPLPPEKSENFFLVPETPAEAPVAPKAAAATANAQAFPQMNALKIPEEPAYAYSPEKDNIRKILRIASIGIVILGIAGAGIYFYLKNNQAPEPTPIIQPAAEPELTANIISCEQSKKLKLAGDITVFQIIRNEATVQMQQQSFERIGILKTSSTGDPTNFLTLSELFQGLGIPVSPYAFAEMKDNYNLLYFNQESGKRLALIIETNNSQNLKNQMLLWEPTLLDDFKNFYPVQNPGQSASKNFLDDTYKGVLIRYKNLPSPTLTLNYTILGNFLVISTSKETMYSIIDRVLGQ